MALTRRIDTIQLVSQMYLRRSCLEVHPYLETARRSWAVALLPWLLQVRSLNRTR